MNHDQYLDLIDFIATALDNQITSWRDLSGDWIEQERRAVATAANNWISRSGLSGLVHVTVDDVERVEGPALGHSDYVRKLSMYVADIVFQLHRFKET